MMAATATATATALVPCPGAAARGDASPAHAEAAFGTRFPVAWLARFTGDQIRAVTVVGDYCRGKARACWASNGTIAAGLGLHERTVAALLREVEGVLVECEHPPGSTVTRRVRQAGRGVRAVWIPAFVRNVLSGNRFKVYCALSYREHLATTSSAKQLAALCGLGEGTARAVAAQLVADGWVSRVEVSGGAFRYTVHAAPLAGVATQEALFAQPQQVRARAVPACVQAVEEQSGCPGQLDLFSLAEPAQTPLVSAPPSPLDLAPPTPLDSAPLTSSPEQALVNKPLPAVVGCGSGEAETSVPRDTRAREADGAQAPTPSRTTVAHSTVVADLVAASPEPPRTPGATTTKPTNGTSGLPPLTISATIHQILRLVPDLVSRMNRWQQREVARAVGKAIREVGGDVDRVADRLLRRYAPLERDEVRDPYAWLIGRGLPRRGCHLPDCESGTDLERGGACRTCAYHVEGAQHRAAARRKAKHEQAQTEARTEPSRPPADTGGHDDQRLADCESQVGTAPPCGRSTLLSDRPAEPAAFQALDGAELPPVTVPARMTADHSEGISLREQLAARRRARELVRNRQ